MGNPKEECVQSWGTMKVLVGVLACHKNGDLQQACRDTWVGKWKHLVDIRFFIGRPLVPSRADEVHLDVPDDYKQLPLKTRAMFQYTLDNGYDRLFKCDDDTHVHIPRLL